MTKRILIIAGPNGAGKTTFAREFLPKEGGYATFVNVDLIAAGLSPFDPKAAEIRAGRIMLELIDEHAAKGENFAFETTFAAKSFAPRITKWRRAGFIVDLVFLKLADENTSIARVKERVTQSGHDVAEDTIRRRFIAGWLLFESTYRNLVDHWHVYDNSGEIPVIIAEGSNP